MAKKTPTDIDRFMFRSLHPKVFMGTASDRYAGWMGQIYTKEEYEGHLNRRSKRVGNKSFVEEVLPVRSVEEYFQHFRVLELDFTFYRPLLDQKGEPTQNYHVMETYCKHLNPEDRLILKVPQVVFAKKMHMQGGYGDNPQYLDAEVFASQFYHPAVKLLGNNLGGLIFEQEYQRAQDRLAPKDLALELDSFFSTIPEDKRYHVELRTDTFLTGPLFEMFQKHGLGQVLSHWTWLPPLSKQFSLVGKRFFNSGRRAIVRLMTPKGVRYEDAYAKAHPFNNIVEGMMNPQMVKETSDIMHAAISDDIEIDVIINNRAGGNAPLIAQYISKQFLAEQED
jgi:uncharacterized protein YecE (DUF72 family)